MATQSGTQADDNAAQTPSSIKVTHRTDRSIFMLLLHSIVRPIKHHVVKLGEPLPAGSPQVSPNKRAARKITTSERIVEDVRIYDLLPKPSYAKTRGRDEKSRTRKRVYYFCGGGWQSPATGEHWALLSEITTRLEDTGVSLVSYPLAPRSPAPTTFPNLMKLYRQVMREADEAGEEVILAGDSAGGNIVLSMVIAALQEDAEKGEQLSCPKAILAICPSTDLRRSNPDMKVVEQNDPLLRLPFVVETARAWCADWDAGDTRVSPLHADLTSLASRGVKVHGITGGYDILGPDAVLFREKCREAGVEGEWLEWDKQMHCFPLAFAFKLRESREAVDWMIDVLKRV